MTQITQADREAAADIWRDYIAKVGECMVEKSMREGVLDQGLPTILATFREAAEARAREEGAKAMLAILTDPTKDYETRVKNAIAALDPAQIAGGGK